MCAGAATDFDGVAHVEMAACPRCGGNGRDRFLHWCLRAACRCILALRVIECSPRLGDAYRAAMATWFFYRTSDFDMRAHRGSIQLDLQAIDLPDACLDVMLCAHVLEHVPDTEKALGELRRVIAPGGHLLLQVPVLQAAHGPARRRPSSTATTRRCSGASASTSPNGCGRPGSGRAAVHRVVGRAVGRRHQPVAAGSAEFDLPGMLAGAGSQPRTWWSIADPAQSRPTRYRARLHVPDLGLPGAERGGDTMTERSEVHRHSGSVATKWRCRHWCTRGVHQ